MAAFALNGKHIPGFEEASLKQGDTGEFSIVSELQEIPIRKNSKFILLQATKSDFLFTNEGTVTSSAKIVKLPTPADKMIAAKKNDKPLPKDKYQHSFNYEIRSKLENNNALNDLKYSLKVVYNFYKPETHFMQQFRDINSDDYKTIVNGWVYTIRTAFGKIVNALPKQNRLEFMLFAMDEFKTIDFVKIPLIDGIEFLNSYVDKRILSRGKLLVATDKLIHSKLKSMVDPKQVGFVDELTGNEKSIHTQALIFQKLQSLQNKKKLTEYLNNSIGSNDVLQTHFDAMFKRETWPIDLRI